MSTDDYPLITLHPMADRNHRWSGLMVQYETAANGENLKRVARLLAEAAVFDTLGHLPCVLPVANLGELDDETLALLPAGRTVLRLGLAACSDPANAGVISDIHRRGFQWLADGLPPADAVLPSEIGAVAVDCHELAVLAATNPLLARLPGPHLAVSVDDGAVYEGCRGNGFRWIAGNYPLHPATAKHGSASPARAVMLKLLGQITGDADARAIEATLKQDPQLSVQLLKLVNSVAFSLNTKITSFSQAITLLGRRQLQRWLQLLLYARPPGKSGDVSPLMPRAALRAGLMEGLCRAAGGSKDAQDGAFMVGMFSLLEVLLGQPVAEVVKPLNLAEDVEAALVDRQGALGRWLGLVELAEAGPSAAVAQALGASAISSETWALEQAHACNWAIQVSREA